MSDTALFDVDPRWSPIDQHTGDLLDLMDVDPIHASDRARVIAAVVKVGMSDRGHLVDQNKLRAELVNPISGEYDVYGPVVGATITSLKAHHVIEQTDYTNVTTGSPHGNNGKPQRVYRLLRLPQTAGVQR